MTSTASRTAAHTQLLTDYFRAIDSVTADNYTRVLITSNQGWVVPATFDERRFFVLDVSPEHMQDTEYFAALRDQAGLLNCEVWCGTGST